MRKIFLFLLVVAFTSCATQAGFDRTKSRTKDSHGRYGKSSQKPPKPVASKAEFH